MPPRSIVLVGPLPPPSGGMANQTRQLSQLLESEGCRVIVVQVNPPYFPAWVARFRGLRALFRLVPYLARLWRAARQAELMHVMANSGWAWHLYAAPAIWIGSLRSIPVVVNYRGGDAEAFFKREFRWVRPTIAKARAVVVPSGFLAAVFAQFGVATIVVPNVVNLDTFRPAPSPPVIPHLIVTRNLEPIYDIDTAIRAFAIVRRQFPAVLLTVAGSGPSRAELEALVRTLGVSDGVTFTGRLDNAALPELYRGASVMLNPSRVDNMPVSLLEAMASGVPVVTTNVGGIPFLVRNEETALLVSPGDAEAMASAIQRILADVPLGLRIAGAASAQAEKYAWDRVKKRLFSVYARATRFAPQRRMTQLPNHD